jgi:hypothetical protein
MDEAIEAPRRPRTRSAWRSRRAAGLIVLGAAVAWAFAWGAHDHVAPVLGADLSAEEVEQRFVIDASVGTLDLAGIEARPGSVVEFVLAGSAGSPHSFVLTGATPGSEMHQAVDAAGDTVIRIRVPLDGGLSFICTIPGHEDLHGSLVVQTGTEAAP